MTPDAVQIIDTVAGLIGGQDDGGISAAAMPTDRAAAIKGNVERLLAARVGPGKAVVEVAVDLVSERESITERTFDPQGRVAISSETEERTGLSHRTRGRGDRRLEPAGGRCRGMARRGKARSSETRERVNYEVSETQREVLRSPGAIAADDGRGAWSTAWSPRPPTAPAAGPRARRRNLPPCANWSPRPWALTRRGATS